MQFDIGLPRMTGEQFRDARRRMRLTQAEFGSMLDCSREKIIRMEKMPIVPMAYTLAAIYAGGLALAEMDVHEAA